MKNKVKGFTLLEMIIVVALFGLIMAGALSLLQPIKRVYDDAFDFEGSRGTVSNVRQFVEDNVKYANRLVVLTNCNDVDYDLSSVIPPGFAEDDASNNLDSTDGINAIEFMRSKFMLGNKPYTYGSIKQQRLSKAKDEIYLLHIDNIENEPGTKNLNLSGYASLENTNRGQVNYQVYSEGTLVNSETKVSNEVLYEDYSLVANLGELITDPATLLPILDADGNRQYEDFNPNRFAISLSIFKNKRDPITRLFNLEETGVSNVITISLENIFKSGTQVSEKVKYKVGGTDTELSMDVPRYSLFDCGQDTNDIILIFTKPPTDFN